MKRILFALLGVGLVCGGYLYFSRAHLSSSTFSSGPTPTFAPNPTFAPKETIDHARAKAKQIEKDSQRHADDLLKKTE